MESFISITQNENNIRPFYIHCILVMILQYFEFTICKNSILKSVSTGHERQNVNLYDQIRVTFL